MSRKSRRLERFIIVALLGILVLIPRLTIEAQEPTLANGDIIPDQYIVVLANNADVALAANDLAQQHSLGLGHIYTHALRGFSVTIPAGRLLALRQDPRVLAIEPDRVVSIADQPSLDVTQIGLQRIPEGILRINGDLSSTAAGDGQGEVDVDVAVIDTGIDLQHRDLNVVGGVNCNRGLDRRYDDVHGHGTHVAGTIGAYDNRFGVVGVAPGARLWAVRVLNKIGFGTTSDVICGIDWVQANADIIEVANMSLGGVGQDDELSCSETTDPQKTAICNAVDAGVTFVVAAGNYSVDAANLVPAAYDMVITVSALADFDGEPGGTSSNSCLNDEDDTFANFSNFGADVDLIAPGSCVLSTWIDGDYKKLSGTSMAAPHVTGAAALYIANHPNVTPEQVRTVLRFQGSDDWDNSDDPDGEQEPLLDVAGF